MSDAMVSTVLALYGNVNTVGEVEVPQFARPTVVAGRSVGRDQYGRPLIVPPGESTPAPYTRASSEAGYLTDGNALRVWQTRRLALALSRFPDLLMRVAVLDPDRFDEDTREGKAAAKVERAELDELITRALDRDGTLSKADWGTAMHKLSEPSTPRDNVPEAMRPDIEAYDTALASRGIVRVESEVFCINDRWRIAGTTDGVFSIPGWGRVVGDLKTGQLHPVQHAVQLAAYAGADRFDPDAPQGQQRTPLKVRQDVGLLIHVLKGTGRCDLFLIDLEHGRRNIALAEQVRDARRSAGLARPFDDVAPVPEFAADEFLTALEARAQPDATPDEPVEDLGVQHPEDAATDPRVQHVVVDPGLGPRLQQQAEHARLERQQADAAARRAAARTTAQDDPEAPMHAKVRTGADVREDAEGFALAPAVERLRVERAEREALAAEQQATLAAAAAQYREVGEQHPGVESVPLPTLPTLPTLPDVPATVLDVNGNPVNLRGDGFDDLRVSDPVPSGDDTSPARGLVSDVLGGVEVSPAQQLAERIALAGSRDEVNTLFREHSPRGEWLEEHHQLAQQRVALLGPHG